MTNCDARRSTSSARAPAGEQPVPSPPLSRASRKRIRERNGGDGADSETLGGMRVLEVLAPADPVLTTC